MPTYLELSTLLPANSDNHSLNQQALAMLGHSYTFTDLRSIHPSFANLGLQRVISVVINEDGGPELGLSDIDDLENVSYYRLSGLSISEVSLLSEPLTPFQQVAL